VPLEEHWSKPSSARLRRTREPCDPRAQGPSSKSEGEQQDQELSPGVGQRWQSLMVLSVP